jgi:hypothetical protein
VKRSRRAPFRQRLGEAPRSGRICQPIPSATAFSLATGRREACISGISSALWMSTGQPPEVIAAEIGDGGSGRLKARLTEALNNYLAPLRARRTELAKDPVYVAGVLRRGIERANAEAESTIIAVRRAMGMVYET